jgi:hypothetical protein
MSRRSIESQRSDFVRAKINQAIAAFPMWCLRSIDVTRIVEMWTEIIEIDKSCVFEHDFAWCNDQSMRGLVSACHHAIRLRSQSRLYGNR